MVYMTFHHNIHNATRVDNSGSGTGGDPNESLFTRDIYYNDVPSVADALKNNMDILPTRSSNYNQNSTRVPIPYVGTLIDDEAIPGKHVVLCCLRVGVHPSH